MKADTDIRRLKAQLTGIMAVDAAWCRKRLSEFRRRQGKGKAADGLLKKVTERIEQSHRRVAQRQADLPRPDYPADLPITAHREGILELLDQHQVLIVAGETGSGKTTQLPKLCLEAGRGTRGLIACTQPRRIAARRDGGTGFRGTTERTGRLVGYQVRFTGAQQPGWIHQVHDRRDPAGRIDA